jgi:hypothetical protein
MKSHWVKVSNIKMSKMAEYLDLLFYIAKCRGLCCLTVSVGSMCCVLFDWY